MSAGYRGGPDHTNKNGARDRFRSRGDERADRIPGFNGVQQGLSCRERMRSEKELEFNYGLTDIGMYVP
jgi:hypothetical protein